MSTTAEQVFQFAMAIANEIPNTGLFTSASLTRYKVRTPYILTMLEAELLREGELFNTYTITDDDAPFSTAADDDVWITIAMPADFKSLDEIRTIDTSGNYVSVPWRWENKNNLIFPAQFEGTLTVSYHAYPSVITALTDTLHVDDVTARTILPYGLVAELYKDEGSDVGNNISSYALARYRELKQGAKKVAQFIDTEDCYGW